MIRNSNSSTPILFTKVIIHGIVTNYNVRELKNGRKSIKMSVTTSHGNASNMPKENYIPAEVDVYIEKHHLVERTKKIVSIGSSILIDGKISFMFIRNNDKSAKKVQYISAEDIVCKRIDPNIDSNIDQNNYNNSKDNEDNNCENQQDK